MDVLTRERAKPALPFAGAHALIDFPLSALSASGIADVWVSSQFQASSLDDYLAGGRPWDLDRGRGGFRRFTPEQGSGAGHDDGFSHGNADDLFRMREAIREFGPDLLIVMSADHVFNLDLRPVMARHLERGAEATVLSAEVGVEEAQQKLVVHTDGSGRVSGVENKPESTTAGTVATEIFLYDAEVVLRVLEELHRGTGDRAPSADTGLGDFGEHLIPALVDRGVIYAEPLPGYWKDVGRPGTYLQAHRDLLAGRIDVFGDPQRPVLGQAAPGVPGWVRAGAELDDAMICAGAQVSGRVSRSVIGRRVRVEAGAVVEDSVILDDVVIEHGAVVRTAVIDQGVRVGRGAVVGATPAETRLHDAAITLVGRDSTIARGARIEAGARLEPGTTA